MPDFWHRFFREQHRFFKGGVGVFEGDRRVGVVGVSGLPGEVDEALADTAIRESGLIPG